LAGAIRVTPDGWMSAQFEPNEDDMTAPIDALEDEKTVAFEVFDRDVAGLGPGAALDRLIAWLDERGEARSLLDALLLKARHDLGLPVIGVGNLNDLAEPGRSQYEERYVAAIRRVGGKLLDAGDLVGAWPYFRVLGEKDQVARAIETYRPSGEPGDESLGQVVDVAFNQGVHPRRGYELILEHYGACSAITAFEHLPPEESTRTHCADLLVRHLHEHLVVNLRSEIERRGQPLPPDGTSILRLIEGRDWLFTDDAYHLDVSHLGAVVRLAVILKDPEALALAVGLTDYGVRLSERHRYPGDPPFEDTYADHAIYLRALLGQDVDAAIAHFQAKFPAVDRQLPIEEQYNDPMPAQVLVRLLVRLDRPEQAIDVAAEHLASLPESMLTCPGVAQLCQLAGRPDRLARIARENGDFVYYAAAMLESAKGNVG
jgi:hypothetical protein